MKKVPDRVLILRLSDATNYDKVLGDIAMLSDQEPVMPVLEIRDTVYFDTEDNRLSAQGLSLKVVQSNGRYFATCKHLKRSGGKIGASCRQTIELPDAIPDAKIFVDHAVGNKLRQALGDGTLVPLFSVYTKRAAFAAGFEHGEVIEITGKSGHISCGAGSMPVCEIEMVLKSGAVGRFLKFAALVSENNALLIETRSLYERGLILAGVESAKHDIRFRKWSGDRPAADELRKILAHYLMEIARIQEAYLAQPDDPENLHQFRVRIRRFRSILSLSNSCFNRDEYLIMQENARKLGRIFARMRELDVCAEELYRIRSVSEEYAGLSGQIIADIEAERNQERQSVYRIIAGGASTSILLGIGAWLFEETCFGAVCRDVTLRRFLRKRLLKWGRRIKRERGNIHELEQPAIHALRIRCKKMRYALEGFEAVLPSDKTGDRITNLKKLQDHLGALCDAKRNMALMKEFAVKAGTSEIQNARWFFNGYQDCRYAMLKEYPIKGK